MRTGTRTTRVRTITNMRMIRTIVLTAEVVVAARIGITPMIIALPHETSTPINIEEITTDHGETMVRTGANKMLAVEVTTIRKRASTRAVEEATGATTRRVDIIIPTTPKITGMTSPTSSFQKVVVRSKEERTSNIRKWMHRLPKKHKTKCSGTRTVRPRRHRITTNRKMISRGTTTKVKIRITKVKNLTITKTGSKTSISFHHIKMKMRRQLRISCQRIQLILYRLQRL